MTSSEELQALMHADPFVPFAFCRDAGDVEVPTRDHVAHAPGTHAAAVVAPDGTIAVIDLAATYVETLEELARQDADDIAASQAALAEAKEKGWVAWDQVESEVRR
jgi:hypothetical protein